MGIKFINFKNIITKSEFRKNVLVLMSGTAVAQIIPILCSPFLTRRYSPADFGLYANFTAVLSFVTIGMTGQYSKAIVVPETDEEAVNVLALSILLAVVCTVVLTFSFVAARKPLTLLLRSPSLDNLLCLIPLCALLYALYDVFNEWCIRRKWFAKLGRNKITNTSGIAGSQIVLSFTKASNGLVFGEIMGRTLSSCLALWRVFSSDRKLFCNVSWEKIKNLAKRYSDFPKFTIPSQLIDSLAKQLPILVMTAQYGAYEIGLYDLGSRLLSTPSMFLGNAFQDVFKQKAAEEYREKGSCLEAYKKAMRSILQISVVPFFLIFIFSPTLFVWIFGQEWYKAGIYARIMSVNAWIGFVFSSTSAVFYVANGQKKLLAWRILCGIANIVVLIGCIFFTDIKFMLIGLCVFRSIGNAIGVSFTYKLAKSNVSMK